MSANKKPSADWVAIEIEFRAGIKSLEQIGKEFGVTKGRISQIAKRDQWTRDLNKRIKAKADARVNESAVNKALNAKRDRLAESTVVDANADLQFRIRMEQRTDITRSRTLFGKLMDELEQTTDNKELFEQLGELLDKSGENADGKMVMDRLNETYRKVISMTGRVDSAKKLTEILEKVVKLEREAFGIESDDKGLSSVDTLLKKINAEAA